MTRGQPVALTTELLTKLAAHWRAVGAPIADHLRTGLTDTQMDEVTASIDVTLPLEARTWWGWSAGPVAGRGVVRGMVSLWIGAIDAGRWAYDADRRAWYVQDAEAAGPIFHRLL